MAVRTKLLAEYVTTAANVVIYTVPAGKTALLKFVTAVNTVALGQNTVSLRANVSGTDRIFLYETMGSQTGTFWSMFVALPPGATVKAGSTTAGVHLTLSGAELDGVA